MSATLEGKMRENKAAWFAMLDRSRITGNKQVEAEARRELVRLGVCVNFFESDAEGDSNA